MLRDYREFSMLRSGILYLACCFSAWCGVPVILDTDLGDDIDDTWALAHLLGTPKVDLQLIVTAADNTPVKTRLAAKILTAMGRTDVPLGMGKQTSENKINQAEWLGDYELNGYAGTLHEDGIGEMIRLIRAAKKPVTLCVIGPQTNIAEALRRAPDIAEKARIVSMAGSVYAGYHGKQGADPEWNVFKDIPAARAVFAAPWEITIAPLDLCGTLILSGERYARVAASKSPLAGVTIANYNQWTNRKNYPAGESSVLFDTAATYLCISEKLAEIKTVKLSIDDKGATVPDETNGRPVRCALSWKDRVKFEEMLVDALTK